MRKLKRWFENKIRLVLSKILKEEYYISADIGIRETEILVCKYSYRTGKMEIISDNNFQKTPLKDIEKEIRVLARKYNASAVADYPMFDKRNIDFNGIR